MTIVATERWSPYEFSRGQTWTGTREFDVFGATNEPDAVGAVYTTFGVTQNVAHPESSLVYCESVKGKLAGLNLWRVTAPYSSTPAGRFPNAGDPLSEPIEVVFDFGSTSDQTDHEHKQLPVSKHQRRSLFKFAEQIFRHHQSNHSPQRTFVQRGASGSISKHGQLCHLEFRAWVWRNLEC